LIDATVVKGHIFGLLREQELPGERGVIAVVIQSRAGLLRDALHQSQPIDETSWFGLFKIVDRVEQLKVIPVHEHQLFRIRRP
jgi:hypothetical protein